jgi:hypothetical protein
LLDIGKDLEKSSCSYTVTTWLDVVVLFEIFALKNPALGNLIAQSASKSDRAVNGELYDILPLSLRKSVVQESLSLHQCLRLLLRLANGSQDQIEFELSSLERTLQYLKAEYPSTCVSALEALVDLAPHIPPSSLPIIGNALCHLACVAGDIFVQTTGRRLLALLDKRMGNSFAIFSGSISPTLMRTSYSTSTTLPPSLVESTLLLWGPLLEQSLCAQLPVLNTLWLKELSSFISALRPLLHESQVNSSLNLIIYN